MNDLRNSLPLGYQLNDEYILEGILGHGGFGITYLARDIALDRQVAIKEYLPQMCALREGHTSIAPKSNSDEAQYLWGLDRFLQEGRILAGFKHPNIVSVLRLITNVNNTAYLVMSYEEGQSLGKYLEQHGPTLPEATLKKIFLPILDGLWEVHKHQLLHRDIKPDNIYLRTDQSPMLLDFGSARYALGEYSHSLSVVISPGYFPPEQLSSRGNQGEWTDVYGVGACLYTCMTGKPPVSADDRSLARNQDEEDPYIPISQKVGGQYSDGLLACVDAALEFKAKERPQTIREFQQLLMNNEYKSENNEGVESDIGLIDKPKSLSIFELKKLKKFFLYVFCILSFFSIVGWIFENSTEAQFQLGSAYGVVGFVSKSVDWYLKAAESGHAIAQYRLGFAYYDGIGVLQSSAEAKKWFKKSGDQGLKTTIPEFMSISDFFEIENRKASERP